MLDTVLLDHLLARCDPGCTHCIAEEQWVMCALAPKYDVSTMGRVRNARTGKVLKLLWNDVGYARVALRTHKGKKYLRVNRLVLISFRGYSHVKERTQCAHLNGDKVDNRLINLDWKTHSENYLDRRRHGTCNAGERNGRAKITDEQAALMRNFYANGMTRSKLAKRFNVCDRTVQRIVTGARAR